jgi:hypothetical protein
MVKYYCGNDEPCGLLVGEAENHEEKQMDRQSKEKSFGQVKLLKR